jgi:hypothetical protein
MNGLENPGDPGAESVAHQSALPFRVAICAWCKPREIGSGLGDVSHGICPRHFREMKANLQDVRSGRAGEPVGPRARRSPTRSRSFVDVAQLGFSFPVPFADRSTLSA